MKKKYFAPTCEAYMLPAGSLCQSIKVSGGTVGEKEDIGFSQKFWGLVDEEESESEFEWDE